MRIGLNLLHAVPEIGGGWNYLQTLLRALGERDRTHTYVAFATAVSAELVPRQPNFTTVRVPLRPGIRHDRVVFEHTVLQALVLKHRLDCLHWFANGDGIVNAAPAVVTVYDLQSFTDAVALSDRKRGFLQWRLRSAARRARVLLPISMTTAQLLASVLAVDASRMFVVPPVLEAHFQRAEPARVAAFRQRHGLPDRFWLYVAHMHRHKNHARLLRAYRELCADEPATWPLVLRGNRQAHGPDLPSLIAALGLAQRVHLMPHLGRDEMPALYSAASALVFPSTHEGAGMPLLEARACGCAIVAADIPAAREFAGEAARFFDPFDVRAISDTMREAQADEAWLAGARARDGEPALVQYRNTPIAETLLEAYASASDRGRAALLA